MVFYVLFESSAGYALFERREDEVIGSQVSKVQESWLEFNNFKQMCSLRAFDPFVSTDKALENINDISEGILNPFLLDFLQQNIPNPALHSLGVAESSLGSAIESRTGLRCIKDVTVVEFLRFIRHHFEKFLKEVVPEEGLLLKTQKGLGHSYSRAKVKFDANKSDNMIIQSISLLDTLDKDINTFAMRVREWYSWHFPELVKIVNDNILYARVARLLKNRADLNDEAFLPLADILNDADQAKLILAAAKTSMGYDIAEFDMKCVVSFADKVVHLAEYRKNLSDYLHKKMLDVAPNLTTLVGDVVGARLINHAGSLTTLAKYPASTVQILGAEKALFRALKTRGNTPKYGLIFNSTFIGRAKAKDKGRISRYLSNKCVIASRMDAFGDVTTTKYGEALRQQVEDRLRFYENGKIPDKNVDVMAKVAEEIKKEDASKPAAPATATAPEPMQIAPDASVEAEEKRKKKEEKKKRKLERRKSREMKQ
uniref:Nucleolar protein 56 n=1 Tax=Arcella intermedia TaxID=1963864 RepID=A0A6B2L2N5_9EUKA|eukprot:TRINITY_DN2776_c0_g1_i1.p1 TRINITY_DN2776_c0_g1~~TRINITY_DN2776_c0_g1_i1.p1  ORF type:complete len:484 (-),score=99.79 TRINITY_DN2776_c0_g1_i1:7-1458(-)